MFKRDPSYVSLQNNPTLKSCWENGKNVIVSYDHSEHHRHALWHNITYFYGNTMDRAKIKSKLQDALEKKRPSDCKLSLSLKLLLTFWR